LLALSLLNLLLLSLLVDFGNKLEALLNLLDNGLDLLSRGLDGDDISEVEDSVVNVSNVILVDDRDGTKANLLLDLVGEVGNEILLTVPLLETEALLKVHSGS
jgi:hypothetical protein